MTKADVTGNNHTLEVRDTEQTMAQEKPTLTYFARRGLGEMPRLILVESGIEWTDNRVDTIDDLKASGKLPYGQVPLLEYPDGFSISQSGAIVRHIARQHGLYGKNDKEAAEADMVFDGANDLRLHSRATIGNDTLREKFISEVLPKWLGFFEAHLKKNGSSYFVGHDITFADIAVYNTFYNMQILIPAAKLEGFPLCQKHFESIASRPRIAEYLKSRPYTAT
ncbi:hypothetical protein PROFUN_02150 [Planoprotostelium fungivorum]|uniref:Glutathione S-transferase n=1 Tax=Planoprotostelium fungivorum TaxID=1890364 RepID=A0A2P6NZ85_9EUKA|nr:hypothetical protein PROFUN_02150 [Planoprotostelium fungivorum]